MKTQHLWVVECKLANTLHENDKWSPLSGTFRGEATDVPEHSYKRFPIHFTRQAAREAAKFMQDNHSMNSEENLHAQYRARKYLQVKESH